MSNSALIYVDTCVWWGWLNRIKSPPSNERDRADIAATHALFEMATSTPAAVSFLYSAQILNELPQSLHAAFDDTVKPLSRRVPIPLTRADGRYISDGSVLMGGRFGGKLKMLLDHSGKDHEALLQAAAAATQPTEWLFKTEPRKAEFDIEHLEAALEADADFFVTVDRKSIINRYRPLQEQYRDDSAVSRALAIAVTPGEALEALKARAG